MLVSFSTFVHEYSCGHVVVVDVTGEMLPHSLLHVADYRVWLSQKTQFFLQLARTEVESRSHTKQTAPTPPLQPGLSLLV